MLLWRELGFTIFFLTLRLGLRVVHLHRNEGRRIHIPLHRNSDCRLLIVLLRAIETAAWFRQTPAAQAVENHLEALEREARVFRPLDFFMWRLEVVQHANSHVLQRHALRDGDVPGFAEGPAGGGQVDILYSIVSRELPLFLLAFG